MNEWKTYQLGDLCNSISNTYRGKAQNVVLINTSDVLEGKCLNHHKEPNENIKGQFKKTFQKGDILYSEIRPSNKRFAYIDFDAIDYIASTKLMVLRANEKIRPLYLFYILQSQSVIDELQMLAESRSGTFPQITFSELSLLTTALPDIESQDKIINILKSLDDKIELNRRINANLEAQAQALFRLWFINSEAQNSNPGFFNDIIQTTLSGDWGQETPKGNYISEVYCIRGADIPDIKCGDKGKLPTRYILEKNLVNKKLSENDLVVEISGGSPTQSTGRICLITKALLNRLDKDVICTNFCRALKPIQDYSFFTYLYWQYLYSKDTMFSYENGTTGIKNLNITDFINKEPIIIPEKKKILEFNKVLQPIFDMIYKNGRENERLSTLRDTLLPKLMAGEINV